MATSSSPRRRELLGGLALGALFLLPLLVWGPWDDEELGLGLFSSQLHYRALFQGRWLWWLNDLGFGTPMPIGQRLDFHPIFALGNLVSLRAALSAVWVVHVAVMVVYFLRLAAVSGIRPPVRTFLLVCYLFSASTVCYFYQTDWISVQVAWSLYPVLVFYLRQAVMGEASVSFWFTALRLALLVAFFIVNSHPGYIAPLAIVLGIYAIAARPSRRTAACLLVALTLAAVVSSERVYAAVSEMAQFPPSLPREAQGGYDLVSFGQAVAAPLGGVHKNLRLPFLGVVLIGCAVGAALGLRHARSLDPHTRASVVAFVAALVLGFAPLSVVSSAQVISAGWLFRDPMLFFGLIAAGLTLQRLYEWPTARPIVWGLLVLQVTQQSATLRPGVEDWRERQGRLQFYRHQGHAEGLARLLVDRAHEFGPRLYLSEEARTLMRGTLSNQGIHAVTDLVFLGLNPIGAWFKGVSMDRLYPSMALMHGLIGGERDVVQNDALLDVLGIDLVLTTAGDGAPPPGLVALDHVAESSQLRGTPAFVLYANPDAWPTATLMTAGTQRVALSQRPGCRRDGALCRDYAALAMRRLPDAVSLDAADGVYRARFSPADASRVLFVSALYRAEWRARSPVGVLPVETVAGAFLGVTIPPGLGQVELAFVPQARIAFTIVSGGALAMLLAAFGVVWWRRPARAGDDVTQR